MITILTEARIRSTILSRIRVEWNLLIQKTTPQKDTCQLQWTHSIQSCRTLAIRLPSSFYKRKVRFHTYFNNIKHLSSTTNCPQNRQSSTVKVDSTVSSAVNLQTLHYNGIPRSVRMAVKRSTQRTFLFRLCYLYVEFDKQ